MKKIGIISMQRVYNHGSFLQAYALKNTIEKNVDDAKCEFVDLPTTKSKDKSIRTKYFEIILSFKIQIHKVLGNVFLFNDIKYIQIYNKCLKKHLNISDVANHNTNYDSVVIGSDEVFNCTQEHMPWFKSMFLFGEGVNSKNIISYAGSFGHTTIDCLNKFYLYDTVKNNIQNFKAISVRDNNSVEIIKEMTNVLTEKHLDPVLIYDWNNELKKIKEKNYIVIYQYTNRITEKSVVEKVCNFAKQNNLKILSVFGYCDWADKNLALTPFEAMSYIKNANYVVTDTFHGCVMSIKFNKQFVALTRSSNINKMTDLLNTFNLTDRLITEDSDFELILKNTIDWKNVNTVILNEKEKSQSYLKKYL